LAFVDVPIIIGSRDYEYSYLHILCFDVSPVVSLMAFQSRTDDRFDEEVFESDRIANDNSFIDFTAYKFEAGSALQLQFAIKRTIDISVSLIAMLVLSPFLMTVALAIRLSSPGPALFSQMRWGKDGSKIRIYKFRSMYIDRCDPTGVVQTKEQDPRVTPLGRILRQTSIDELPQLFNVLKGDMSLVGPRCHAIGMTAAGVLYEQLVPQYHQRHCVRPGITGLAQVRGYRGPTDTASLSKIRIACDLHYIRSFSIWLDLKILVLTLWIEVRGGKGF
jgi:polysaccharide biosynthesis protein PslA